MANLLVLASGCEELSTARVLAPRIFVGLRDTLRVLLEACGDPLAPLVSADMIRKIQRLIEDLGPAPSSLVAAHKLLSRLQAGAIDLTTAAGNNAEVKWWAAAYERGCNDHHADLLHLAPWLAQPTIGQDSWTSPTADRREQLIALRSALEQTRHFGHAARHRRVAPNHAAPGRVALAIGQLSWPSLARAIAVVARAGLGERLAPHPTTDHIGRSISRVRRCGFQLALQFRARPVHDWL